MALLLLDQGKPAEAQTIASRAVAADPKNSESYSFLGRALLAQNEYSEALQQFDRGISIQGNDASLHYGRAAALENLNRPSDAEISLRLAVQMSPEPDGLVKVAESDRTLRRVDDALKYCRRALKMDPNHATANRLTARILTEEGRLDEAASYWDRAKELGTDVVDVYVTKANALLTAGLFEAGIAEFRGAVEIAPRRWEPYNGIVSAKRVAESDRPLVAQMHHIIEDPATSIDDRLNLHYAIGKAHDNLGEYELAMHHFDEANRMKLNETQLVPHFSADELRGETDDKIRTFTPALIKQIHKGANTSDRPTFVVGMMRSGTTLAEQILTCHSRVGGASEQPFWREWEPQVINWKNGHVYRERLQPLADRFCTLLNTIAPGKRHVVDKNPANSMIVGLLHLAYPNARIIHTVRHPVDTALSIWMTLMQTAAPFVCDRDHIVFAYREYQRLADHWRSVISPDRYLEVQYEDLVLDREQVTRQMVEFCDLEWEDACLYPENNLRAVKTPSFWQVRQPVYATSLERWKHYEPWLGAFRELLPSRV